MCVERSPCDVHTWWTGLTAVCVLQVQGNNGHFSEESLDLL